VIICEAAGNSLKQCYPRVRSVLPLSNAFLLPPPESSIRASTGTLRVGHLGNLSRAKGIDLVLDTVRGAARRGLRVQLDVAGPVSDSRAAEDLARFEREFPGTLTCHGLLADAGKARFFDSLDVFLFPSRLPEIEGIVNLEAMRSGVVPIAFAHGCIASNFACGGGVCVEPSDDFAARAVDCLLAWNADRDALNEARSAVWRRYGELWRRAQAQAHEVLDAFMKLSAQVG
jgi:glycosyltransferase involved in cell wall biosynthesis